MSGAKNFNPPQVYKIECVCGSASFAVPRFVQGKKKKKKKKEKKRKEKRKEKKNKVSSSFIIRN